MTAFQAQSGIGVLVQSAALLDGCAGKGFLRKRLGIVGNNLGTFVAWYQRMIRAARYVSAAGNASQAGTRHDQHGDAGAYPLSEVRRHGCPSWWLSSLASFYCFPNV